MQIIINEVPIYFEVQFSKRSKINLDVSPEGYLTLKVPTKTSAVSYTHLDVYKRQGPCSSCRTTFFISFV